MLTDRGAVVTGTVADERGAPAAGARVILFRADPARREPVAAFESTIRTNKDGRFTFPSRRPGDYLILALPGTGELFSTYTRETFERFAAVAERVTLVEADRRTVDLRVSTLPDRRIP